MTTIELIFEHRVVVSFFALSCIATLILVTQAHHLNHDWHAIDGFEFKISGITALVGCLAIILLAVFLDGDQIIFEVGN